MNLETRISRLESVDSDQQPQATALVATWKKRIKATMVYIHSAGPRPAFVRPDVKPETLIDDLVSIVMLTIPPEVENVDIHLLGNVETIVALLQHHDKLKAKLAPST